MVTTNKERLEKKSADYAAMAEYWDMAQAFSDGLKSVLAAGTKYMPKFPDESPEDFTFRQSVAKLTNIYADIIETLSAKPFEKEVKLTKPASPPQQLADFMEDVDGSGNNISVFSRDTFYSGINMSLEFIFVDYPDIQSDTIRTVADEKMMGLRPFWSHVLATNVYEIKSAIIAGKEQISYIRIFEPSADGNVFREMKLDAVGATYKTWKWSEPAKDYLPDGDGIITIGVIPIVPFITGYRKGKSWQTRPPMKAALELQKTLFNDESDLQFAKKMSNFPMLVGEGVKPEIKGGVPVKLSVGPSKVLYAGTNNNGQASSYKYLEPAATSLTFAKEDIGQTKGDLRELGRQPLTAQSGITTIQAATAADKSGSAVKLWGVGLTDTLTIALDYTMKWFGANVGEISVQVYDEYDDLLDPSADLGALGSARTSRDLSQETYWEELQRRKVLSNDFTAEREKTRLLEETPDPGNDPTLNNDPLNNRNRTQNRSAA